MVPVVSGGPEWHNPTARERRAILEGARTIAMVGASPNPARASFFVATYLLSATDYEVTFVNPHATQVLGRPVVPTLADLAVAPDIVDVFRRPADLPEVLDEAIAVGARVLWLQLGLRDEAIARRGHAAGMTVVIDRCLKIEHARFHGGLHTAGFDTGVVTSRRRGNRRG